MRVPALSPAEWTISAAESKAWTRARPKLLASWRTIRGLRLSLSERARKARPWSSSSIGPARWASIGSPIATASSSTFARTRADTMRRWMRHATARASLLALALAPSALRADPVSDFYKGRQITMILSADAGGGYGSYANAFAPYLSQHIRGKPKIVVQFMPGAGGLRAMNYLYS